MLQLALLLSRTSPAQVPALTSYGAEMARALLASGAALMRTSPKRASPCTGPAEPAACPPSLTRPMLRLPCTAQVWKARRISRCQVCGACAPSKANSRLCWSPTVVPSGTKLRVRCVPSGQGLPKVVGVQRSSSCSRVGIVRGGMSGSPRVLRSRPFGGWAGRAQGADGGDQALELGQVAQGVQIMVGVNQVVAVALAQGRGQQIQGACAVFGFPARGEGVDAAGLVETRRTAVAEQRVLGVGVRLSAP